MKKTFTDFFPLGFSSIITVFITIFFFTFAGFSLASAYSDYRQSQKNASETDSYYAADAIAREMTAHIDNLLFDIYLFSPSADIFYQTIKETDFTKNIPEIISDVSIGSHENSAIISYLVPISNEQQLSVALKINYPLYENECFSTIIRWQKITTKLQTSERTLSQ